MTVSQLHKNRTATNTIIKKNIVIECTTYRSKKYNIGDVYLETGLENYDRILDKVSGFVNSE
jgi:hypothetical protein